MTETGESWSRRGCGRSHRGLMDVQLCPRGVSRETKVGRLCRGPRFGIGHCAWFGGPLEVVRLNERVASAARETMEAFRSAAEPMTGNHLGRWCNRQHSRFWFC